MVEFGEVLKASLIANFHLLFVAFGGYILVKLKIIDKNVSRGLGSITLQFVLPCLIFSSIIRVFRADQYQVWGPLLYVNVVSLLVSYLVGWIVSRAFKFKTYTAENMVIILLALPQTASI
jgi:predicted permease